jgi:hypothetical protein
MRLKDRADTIHPLYRLSWNATAALACATAIALLSTLAHAHDNGRFANSPLKPWFESLATKAGGACCASADAVIDVAWDTTSEGHYRVQVWGQWVVVPDEAVIKVPNRLGRPIVWPYIDDLPDGAIRLQIKCFLPGAEG